MVDRAEWLDEGAAAGGGGTEWLDDETPARPLDALIPERQPGAYNDLNPAPPVSSIPEPPPEAPVVFDLPEPAPMSMRGTRVTEGIQALGRVPDRSDLIEAEGQQQRAEIDAIVPESYAGQALTYDEASLGQRAGEQFRGGIDAARGGYNLLTGTIAFEELQALDRADRGERLADNARTPWHEFPPEQRARARASLERRFAENMRQHLRSQTANAARLRNPRVQELAEAVDSGRVADAWRIFSSDPAGIIQQLSVESLPHMALPLAGGLIGGMAGLAPGLVGAGLGSVLSDAGPRFAEILGEQMKEAGVDMEDAAAVTAYVRANPGAVTQARQDASRGAQVVAAADVASFGTAAGLRRGAGALANAGRVGRNVVTEIGTEGLGEAGAQMASVGEITPSEVLFEMLGSAPQAAGTTAFATLQQMRQGQPGAAAPAADPSAGRVQALRDALNPTPGSPNQPLVPAGEGTPPPPAAAAPPPGSPQGGTAAPAGAAAPIAPGVPAAEGSEPAAGPGQGAAAPQPSSPVAATPPLPAAPPVPPPPPVNTGRASLEEALNAPPPEVVAQQRQQQLEQFQAAMPPGFTVTDEDGAFFALDPDGDMIGGAESYTPETAAAWRADAQRRIDEGLYPQAAGQGAPSPFSSPSAPIPSPPASPPVLPPVSPPAEPAPPAAAAQPPTPQPAGIAVERDARVTDGDRFILRSGAENVGFARIIGKPGARFIDSIQIESTSLRGQGNGQTIYDQIEQQIGERLVPSPLGLYPPAEALWRRRLAAMPRAEAEDTLRRAREAGIEYGANPASIDARLAPLLPAAPEASTPQSTPPAEQSAAGEGAWWDSASPQERRRVMTAAGVRKPPAAAWASFSDDTRARLDAARAGGTSQLASPNVTTPAPAAPNAANSLTSAAANVTTPPADVTTPAPQGASAARPGKVGDMLAAGEVVQTVTGRPTTPFPKLGFGSDRKAQNTVRRVDQWLMDNAIAEAEARGDEFNAAGFRQNRDRPSQSDKDSAEMYLFDPEMVQPIPAPFTRPISAPPTPPKESPEQARMRAEAQAIVRKGEREQRRNERNQRRGTKENARRSDSLIDFIAKRGGLKDDRGDLRSMAGGQNPFVPGFGRLIRPTGMAFDRALEAAIEAGWMPEDSTVNDLLEQIDAEMRGAVDPESRRGQQRAADRAEIDAERYAERLTEIRDLATEMGATLRSGEAEAAAALAASEGIDIADALTTVLERELGDAVDEAADAAADGSEWGIPWDEKTDAAGRPRDAGEGREEASSGPAWLDDEPEAGASPAGDSGGEGGGGGRPAPVQTETVRTLDGTGEQGLIPGVAPVTDRDRLGVMADKPLRGGAAPPPAGGLFDDGATQQTDMLDMPGVRPQKKPDASFDTSLPLFSTPFDPAAFNRLLWQPLKQALGGSTALTNLGRVVRDENIRVVKRLWRGAPVPAGVSVKDPETAQDISAFARYLMTPVTLFRRFPELQRLVQAGIKSEMRQSSYITRLTEDYDRTRTRLSKAGGDWGKVQTAIWAADAEGINIENPDVAREFFEAEGLNAAEARAAGEVNRLFVTQARMVDMHRRSMLPKVRARKAEVWRRMQRTMGAMGVPTEAYGKLYRRRTYLAGRIRAGTGDLAKQAAELERINAQLVTLRQGDPEVQATMAKLQEEYDALEARLAATSVRTKEGYAPHKFYGSWRLFLDTGLDEEGNPTRQEITSDLGFFDSKDQAIARAAAHLRENPDATLSVEPRVAVFPSMHGGATLSDTAYARLKQGLEKAAKEEGITADTVGLLKGVARRRNRRRTFSPGMKREGAEGYAADLDKVMRTHIGQTVRYVEMDKLKFDYVSTTEREGLSPTRAASLRQEGRKNVQDAIEAWWRDVNGTKQPGEEQLDNMLTRMPVPRATLFAMVPGLIVSAAGAPITGGVLAAYGGFRMYRGLTKGGGFPTRSIVSGVTSDMAHLKLGMLFNLGSAFVNLTQTFINTYPVLGERWVGEGITRAAAALASQARNQDAPGRMSTDAHLLARADVQTRYRFAEDNPVMAEAAGAISRLSMLPFTKAEQFNRAAAFLGAYHRAVAGGASPGEAFRQGEAVLTRTQFHQGNANKPEILRAQWARIPLQFKNFMVQQITFMFGLRGKAEVARFALALFLVGGALALPGLQLLDWLVEMIWDVKPSDAVAEWIADAQGYGDLAGGTLQAIARGMPALLGADITQRVGMGAGFLPDQGSDMRGPAISTGMALWNAERQAAQLVDTLTMVTPAAVPLKVLEAAANGASMTSSRFWSGENFGDGQAAWTNPRKRGAVEIEPTTAELAVRASGLQPIRWSERGALQRAQQARVRERRQDETRYLARMVQAQREGRSDRIGEIRMEAAREGVRLTPNRIRDALRDARLERADRSARSAPRQDRGDLQRRLRAIDERTGVE